MRNAYKVLVRKPGRRGPPGRLGVDEKIILKWILRIYCLKMWTEFIWHKIGTTEGLL
jgi:hypothetical protein